MESEGQRITVQVDKTVVNDKIRTLVGGFHVILSQSRHSHDDITMGDLLVAWGIFMNEVKGG